MANSKSQRYIVQPNIVRTKSILTPSRSQAPRHPASASEGAQSCQPSPTKRPAFKRPPPEYFERLLEQAQARACLPSPTEAATPQSPKSQVIQESTVEPTEGSSNNKPTSSRPLNTNQTLPSQCSVIKSQCSPPKPQPSRPSPSKETRTSDAKTVSSSQSSSPAANQNCWDFFTKELFPSLGETMLSPSTSCLLYTSPSPRDKRQSRMPSSA